MKSAYYAAAVTNAYRHALDSVKEGKRPASCWIREMEMISHRPYCTGFYYGDPGQHYAEASYFSDADVCAVVLECDTEGNAVLSQRNKFSIGDQVDLLTKDHEPYTFTVDHLEDGEGAPIESAPHATMTLRMKLPFSCEPLSLLRKMK